MATFLSLMALGKPGASVAQFGYPGVTDDQGFGRFTITHPDLVEIEKAAKRLRLLDAADLAPTTTQEAPVEVAQEAPVEVAQEAPAEVAQEAQAEVAQEAPAEVAQEAPAPKLSLRRKQPEA